MKVLRDLLEDLDASDWTGPVHVVMDSECQDNAEETVPDRRSNRCFRLAVERGWQTGAPWFLVLEDDSEVNRHLRHNLDSWEPLVSGLVGYGKLSTNGGNRDSFAEGTNWYTPDSGRVYGLQGAVLTHDFARHALAHWDEVQANVDIKLARLGGSNRAGRMYTHWPSLVRHRDEVPSLCQHGLIRTLDFDKEFRA